MTLEHFRSSLEAGRDFFFFFGRRGLSRKGGLVMSATTLEKKSEVVTLFEPTRMMFALAVEQRGGPGLSCLTGKYTLLINALLLHVQRGWGAGWWVWEQEGGFTTGIRSA